MVCRRGIMAALVLLLAWSSLASAQGLIADPVLTSWSPGMDGGAVVSGQVVEITGQNFSQKSDVVGNERYQAVVYGSLNGQRIYLPSQILSDTKINFMVPVGVPCGALQFFIINANLFTAGGDSLPSESGSIDVRCDPFQEVIAGPDLLALDTSTVTHGERVSVQGENFFVSSLSQFAMTLTLGGVRIPFVFRSPREITFEVPSSLECGAGQRHRLLATSHIIDYRGQDFSENAPLEPSSVRDVTGAGLFVNLYCAEEAPPEEEPDLSGYDDDGNCRLGDFEFFALVDLWIINNVSDETFFAAVDAWVAQSDICPAPEPAALAARRSRLAGQSSPPVIEKIEVFDLGGQRVYARDAGASSLSRALDYFFNNQPANGVYLVLISRYAAGAVWQREWKHVVVLR